MCALEGVHAGVLAQVFFERLLAIAERYQELGTVAMEAIH